MNNFHSKDTNEVFKIVNSSYEGLTSKEATKRLVDYGKNCLSDEKPESFFKRLLRQLSDIMVIILIISGIISIVVALCFKNYEDLFEGILILFICFTNALIGVIQEGKAENALLELKKNTQSYCKVKRDGKIVSIESEMLTIGDIVILESGDIVPADIRLIRDTELKCDESCLTGESESIEKNSKYICEPNSVLSKHKNMLYSKTIIVNGHCEGIVVNIGMDTQIGKIANDISSSAKEATPIQKSLTKLNEALSIIILIICALVYLVEVFKGGESFLNAFLTAVTLAVAAVPESLPAVTTIIMAMGVSKLSKKKAIVKRLPTIETLGCCQVICTDKTGTLTMNKMEVKEIFLPRNEIISSIPKTMDCDLNKMVHCMILNNNAFISSNIVMGDSTETALLNFGIKCGYNVDTIRKNKPLIFEIPFDSNRKLMTTVIKDKFVTSYSKGSLENILKKCSHYLNNGVIDKLSEQKKKEFLEISSKMNKKALRVLGYAYKEFSYIPQKIECEDNMIFIGSSGMVDPPRQEVYQAIQECYSAGLTPIMITGDSKDTAFSIGKDLKICKFEEQVITGEELNKISDSMLLEKLEKFKIFARVNPEHKVRIVEAYQKKGKIVAMTGDGVNDAPSLKKANIGVGMGSGTEVAKSASDMIITDDNFSTIVVAIKEGRKIFQNIQKTLQFLLSTNLVEVVTIFFTSIFFPSFVFLLPSQLLFINLVTDGLPAFSLGLEKAEKNIMKCPPRKNSTTIFSKQNIIDIIVQAGYQIVVLMLMYILGIKYLSIKTTCTMCFFTFSIMQINHSINMKTTDSIFKSNLFDNKYFNFSYLFCMLCNLLLAVTPLRQLFSLSILNLSCWIIVLIASFSIIPFVEIQKLIVKSTKKSNF